MWVLLRVNTKYLQGSSALLATIHSLSEGSTFTAQVQDSKLYIEALATHWMEDPGAILVECCVSLELWYKNV